MSCAFPLSENIFLQPQWMKSRQKLTFYVILAAAAVEPLQCTMRLLKRGQIHVRRSFSYYLYTGI